MVNINTVYLTVQALINKEQRGYLTPLSFNKFSEQAQNKIFEMYFNDLSHFNINPKGMGDVGGYSSQLKILKEKIDVFSVFAGLTDITNAGEAFALPTDLYRLNTVEYNGTLVQEMDKSMSTYIKKSGRTQPTLTFPKFEKLEDAVKIYPITVIDSVSVHYIKRPATPKWGYLSPGSTQVTNIYPELAGLDVPSDALYNPGTSVDFELHISDQYRLIEIVLKYAGVEIREADIVTFAQTELQSTEVNQKQ